MTKIFVIVEEDIVGARAVYASDSKEKCEQKILRDFPRELRFLADGVWRCGSSILSIQETECD